MLQEIRIGNSVPGDKQAHLNQTSTKLAARTDIRLLHPTTLTFCTRQIGFNAWKWFDQQKPDSR